MPQTPLAFRGRHFIERGLISGPLGGQYWIRLLRILREMALLCKGTKVLVSADGTCRRVEELQVGDQIFDPLAQKIVEVSNIVPWLAGQDASTAPVLIPKHSISGTQPNEDFFAPQTLEIFVATKAKGQPVPVARRVLARNLVDEGIARIADQLAGLQCYLVLTNEAAMIMTNGILSVGKSMPQNKSA